MSSTPFTIVMCLKLTTHRAEVNNLSRFMGVGLRTYQRWLRLADVRAFIVIVPEKERKLVEAALRERAPEFPWTFVAEEALVDAAVPPGWARQQTAKLAVARMVETPTYLIVDDDTFLVRPFGAADLVAPDGGLRFNRTDIDFPFFFLWSAQVLGVDYEEVQTQPFHMAITPEPFVTDVVRDLVGELAARHGDWQRAIAAHKFTEYCLYWIYVVTRGLRDRYYTTDATCCLYDHCVTSPDQLGDLGGHLARAFGAGAHYFSFVQTSLPVTTEAIVECLNSREAGDARAAAP